MHYDFESGGMELSERQKNVRGPSWLRMCVREGE